MVPMLRARETRSEASKTTYKLKQQVDTAWRAYVDAPLSQESMLLPVYTTLLAKYRKMQETNLAAQH
jgi:hypothetical protein